MRVLIADDERPARSKLRRLLSQESDVEIVAESATGREALAAIRRLAPDVVFLDVQMPGLDGFGVVDALVHDEPPHVVFVTAFDDHALRAFDVGAVDYLLKPYTPARFALVLTRARERVAARLATRRPEAAIGALSSRVAPATTEVVASLPYLRRLLVHRNGRARFLAINEIDRVESDRNHVELIVGVDRYRLRATIAAVGGRLDPAQFLRLNRSTIVRLDQIGEMHEWSHGDYRVTLKDGTVAIWSRRYRAAAERDFGVG